MSQQAFKKFVNQKSNAAIKEKFRQEKKAEKKARQEAINKRFEEKRQQREATPQADDRRHAKPGRYQKINKQPAIQRAVPDTLMPLNKFLAHCGVGSRRDVIQPIKDGSVTVNGKVVTEPGFKVDPKDEVKFNGKTLFVTRNMVYILMNKPKDYVTTADDPQGRKTVLDLIRNATTERIYPVGRLDRNTSGVLLLTNDGELTQKLTHPSYNVKKLYEVKLDKPVTKAHFEKILNGITLEDGKIHADALAYADNNDRSIIGIELHSGRNRIVRRIFEHLGYKVKALDRVMYGELTKKNVERGKWRYLSEKEVRHLKHTVPQRKVKQQ